MSGATVEADAVRVPLALGPYEAKVIVMGPLPAELAAEEPSLATGNTLAELNGDWTIELNGKQLTTPLKSWEDLGAPPSPVRPLRKQFDVPRPPPGSTCFWRLATCTIMRGSS